MTETTQALTLDDLVWPDGAVRATDSAFPIQWMEGDQVIEETKIIMAVVPEAQGGGYALAMWTKGVGNGPLLHSLRRVTSIQSLNRLGRIMTLEDGATVQYGPSRKCGCGSRLRSYRPWGPTRVIAVAKPQLPYPPV